MTRLVWAFARMLLVIIGLAFGQKASPSSLSARSNEGATCDLASLPPEIQNRLNSEHASWKVQEAENLSEYARKTWAGAKPTRCPGLAMGLFQTGSSRSYALLLVPRSHPDTGYRFLVFSRKPEQPSYEELLVEKLDDHGASNYFIRQAPITQFFDRESKRKFQPEGSDVILMIDSAEQEYGAVIYFWSHGHYRQEPVDE